MTLCSNKIYATWPDAVTLPVALERGFRNLDAYLRETIASTREMLLLVAPYLTPEGITTLQPLLASVAERDAWIRLVVRSPDLDDYNLRALEELTRGSDGSRIRSRLRVLTVASSHAALLHAKLVIADGQRGYLGSANLTHMALQHNLEVGVALGHAQARKLSDLFAYLETSGFLSTVQLAVTSSP